jgi:hypothetical protein
MARARQNQIEVKERSDGRRSLLVYLNTDLIKILKKQALDEDINVYELVERLLLVGLEQEKPKAGFSD